MGSLFSKPKAPKMPEMPPLLMADELTLKRARRRRTQAIAARSGRASTILTQPGRLEGVV